MFRFAAAAALLALASLSALAPTSLRAETAELKAELNILARDLPAVVNALTSLHADFDVLGRGVLAMNETLAGRNANDALREARAALTRAPADFGDHEARIARLDWSGLKSTRYADAIAKLEDALSRLPRMGEDIRAHLELQIEAGERGQVDRLAELAQASSAFNIPLTEIGVQVNRVILLQMDESDVQFGINAAYLAIAQGQLDILRLSQGGSSSLDEAIAIARGASDAIRKFIGASEERLVAKVRASRARPDAETSFIGDRPLLELVDEFENFYADAYRIERAFADEFDAMARAYEDLEAGRDRDDALGRLTEIDRRFAALFQERAAMASASVEILQIFRDLEL